MVWVLLLFPILPCLRAAYVVEGRTSLLLRGAQPPEEVENNSTGSLDLPPEGAAKADFVRRCSVAVSAKKKNMLPLEALEDFCRSTDAVVKCKTVLVKGLEETHANGGSVSRFCANAYLWFQDTYGMLCPMQCQKLQCKSTCMWLKEKEKLKEKTRVLRGDSLEVSNLEEIMDAVAKEVNGNKATITKTKRKIDAILTRMDRANKTLLEHESYVEKVKNKVIALKKAVEDLEDKTKNYTGEIRQQKNSLQAMSFAVDQARMKDGNLKIAAESLYKRIVSEVALLEPIPHEIARRRRDLEEQWAAHANLTESGPNITAIIAAQEAKMETKRSQWETAQGMLSEAEASTSSSGASLVPMRILVDEQKAKFKREEIILEDAKHLEERLQMLLNRSAGAAEVITVDIQRREQKSLEKSNLINNMVDQFRKVETESQNVLDGTNLVVVGEKMEETRRQMRITSKALVSGTKALKLNKVSLAEDQEKLDKQDERKKGAQEALDMAKDEEAQARDELAQQEKVLLDSIKKEEGLKLQHDTMIGNVTDAEKALDDEKKRLNRLAPAIVMQHGLGLLQVLSEW